MSLPKSRKFRRAAIVASLVLNVVLCISVFKLVERLGGVRYQWWFLKHRPDFVQGTREWFKSRPPAETRIVFAGDSITLGFMEDIRRHDMEGDLPEPWRNLVEGGHIRDRAISGDTITKAVADFDTITRVRADKLFLAYGINDLCRGATPQQVAEHVARAISLAQQANPAVRVHVQSILPIRFGQKRTDNAEIVETNRLLREACDKSGATFIDLHGAFADAGGELRSELTVDGMHPGGPGHVIWRERMGGYVSDHRIAP